MGEIDHGKTVTPEDAWRRFYGKDVGSATMARQRMLERMGILQQERPSDAARAHGGEARGKRHK